MFTAFRILILMLLLGVAAAPAQDPLTAEERAIVEAIVSSKLTPPGLRIAGSLTSEVILNKDSYRLGEPIIVTLRIHNISEDTVHISTGGDYRAGRSLRFEFEMTDAEGQEAPDLLGLQIAHGMGGGLGSGIGIAPGESHDVHTLLNLYRHPREPGKYTLRTRFGLWQEGVVLEPADVIVHVVPERCRMTYSEVRELFDHHRMSNHEIILDGLHDNTPRIRTLLRTAVGRHSIFSWSRYTGAEFERNESYSAMQAAVMMSDRKTLVDALVREVARSEPWSDEFKTLQLILVSSTDESSMHLIEDLMIHDNPAIRGMAIRAAIKRGSYKALAFLPEMLREPDPYFYWDAVRFLLMSCSHGAGPEIRLEVPESLQRAYFNALWDAYPEHSPYASVPNMVVTDFYGSPYYVEAFQRVLNSLDESERQSLIRYTMSWLVRHSRSGWSFMLGDVHAIIPDIELELGRTRDEHTRSACALILTVLGSRDCEDMLRMWLDSPDTILQFRAAAGLLLLDGDRDRENCIRILARGIATSRKHGEFSMLIGTLEHLGYEHAVGLYGIWQTKRPDEGTHAWRLYREICELLIRGALAHVADEPFPLESADSLPTTSKLMTCINKHSLYTGRGKWSTYFNLCDTCFEPLMEPATFFVSSPSSGHSEGARAGIMLLQP